MHKVEALTAMGVKNPEYIDRYAVYLVDNTDILRIIYSRKARSILPVSINFRFPRLKKSTLVDSGTRQTEIVYESSPEFRRAVAELDQLMEARKSTEDLEELLNHEIRVLEEEVTLRINGIKSLVKRITSKESK